MADAAPPDEPPEVVAEPFHDERSDGSPGEAADLVSPAGLGPDAARDLALAFRSSARAVESVRDLQAEMVKALKRQDRSEMMLQSTQALNDTFRNLIGVQRALLTRLEDSDGAKVSATGRLVPLMLIALLVVFLGGTYVVLDVLEQFREERRTAIAAPAVASGEDALSRYREGVAEGRRAAEVELSRLEDRLAEVSRREEALREDQGLTEEEKAELQAQVRLLETEREGLAAQVIAARNEVMARRALEDEVRSLNGQIAVMTPRMQELEETAIESKAEIQRLRKRLAALGMGYPDEGTPEGRGPGEGTEPTEAPAVRPPPIPEPDDVDRSPQLLSRIRTRMNEILTASGRGRDENWQLTRIEGVSSRGLHNVIALRYDTAGKLLDQVSARELAIHVDRGQRNVVFEFRDGNLVFQGSPTPFQGGVLRRVVAAGNFTRLWSQSGLLFVK